MSRVCVPILAWAVCVALLVGCSEDEKEPVAAPAAMGSPGCATEGAPVPGAGTTSESVEFAGRTRTYELSIPEGYDGETPAPVVLNLHGASGTGKKVNTTSRMPERAGARGYVVIAPDALNHQVDTGTRDVEGGIWDIARAFLPATAVDTSDTPTDDLAFLNALLDSIETQLCIDTSREYASGKSNGAGMSTWLGCQPERRFAAIAPVAGINMPKNCPGGEVPPVINFHGDSDELMPYAGVAVMGIDLGVPDVDTRLEELAEGQACSAPTETKVADDVLHLVWDCPKGAAVEHYKVLDGGHTWPGEDPDGAPGLGRITQSIDATDLILDFFELHRIAS